MADERRVYVYLSVYTCVCGEDEMYMGREIKEGFLD